MPRRKGARRQAGPNTEQTSRANDSNAVRPRLRGDHRCRCSACGEMFATVSTFDRHRVGDYESGRCCLSVSEMLARRWIQNSAGFWIRGHRPNINPALSQFAQNRRSAETLGLRYRLRAKRSNGQRHEREGAVVPGARRVNAHANLAPPAPPTRTELTCGRP
jgi:hypothetical protein